MRFPPFFPFALVPAAAGAGDFRQSKRPDRSESGWLLADDPNRTVRAGRRRRTEGDPADRERAEAPTRDTPPSSGGGGGYTPSGGGGGYRPSGGGGFNIPGGSKGIAGGGIGILVLCAVVAFTLLGGNLGGGGGSNVDQGDLGGLTQQDESGELAQLATEAPRPTLPPAPTRAAQATSATSGAAAGSDVTPGQTWTVMIYGDADDKILEQDIFVDLNEAERVGSTDRVKIVAQLDRYKGGFSGDGNWTSTRRYLITKDDNLGRIGSEVVGEGELNMSAGETLVDFVTWAAENYPADKYILILSDHGMGWPGGWSDPDPGQQRQEIDRRIPLHQSLGDELYLNEIDAALATARQQAGIERFEIVGMDACLMGHVEVMEALEPHARYAVFSQETEPALGWAYTAFLGDLAANPDVDGATVARSIVDSYIDEDQRILDDQARAEWIGQRGTAAQVRNQLSRDITLTAANLGATRALVDNLNQLAYAMQNADQQAVAKARRYAQSFTSIFGQQVPPSYIDLGHFLVLLTQSTDDEGVNQAARGVAQALTEAVVAKKNGQGKPGATGLSIYFPTGQLYQTAAAGPQSYTAIANRFAENSLWDEFLTFHYSGRQFQPDTRGASVPASGLTRAPGAGQITLSPVQQDKTEVAIRDTVLLSTNVSGDNIGYIYFFTGFLDRATNSIAVIDRDYLEAPETKELSGVYYPDWGEGDFKLEFEWEPLAFAISDGETSAQAALNPETYGQSYEESVYTVDGIYTYQDGEQRYARAYFRDGILRQVFGFTEEAGTPGAPWQITPTPGDQFTPYETWLEQDGQGGLREVQELGETLTFRDDQPFEWRELDAAAGEYVVGFIVADLEGNKTEAYTTVTVLP
ncbi:MAG: clostripain-related cysteine peptidase [Anaerolineae bacterium]|nr:clostripain-related cysteine peptidase [Anaerolineae bacterium]